MNLKKCLRALDFCDGVVRQVSDQEIMDAKARVGAGGLGCEPASAASVAGAKRLREEGVIAPSETVVCILTGHQLKDPTATVAYHGTDQDNFEKVLGSRGVRRAGFANRPVIVAERPRRHHPDHRPLLRRPRRRRTPRIRPPRSTAVPAQTLLPRNSRRDGPHGRPADPAHPGRPRAHPRRGGRPAGSPGDRPRRRPARRPRRAGREALGFARCAGRRGDRLLDPAGPPWRSPRPAGHGAFPWSSARPGSSPIRRPSWSGPPTGSRC